MLDMPNHRRRPVDAETVVYRLEEAGRTLIALPGKGCLPAGYGSGWPDVVHAAVTAYGYMEAENRVPVPSPQVITRMDEAFRWVGMIPPTKRSHRRIVLMRAMVNPRTERHCWSWRRIGRAFGWDRRAIQSWHAQGVDMIVEALQIKSSANVKIVVPQCTRNPLVLKPSGGRSVRAPAETSAL
jgi:hypothetical protein